MFLVKRSKKTIQYIGHCAHKKDVIGQLYDLYASTGTYQAWLTLHFAVAGNKAY